MKLTRYTPTETSRKKFAVSIDALCGYSVVWFLLTHINMEMWGLSNGTLPVESTFCYEQENFSKQQGFRGKYGFSYPCVASSSS